MMFWDIHRETLIQIFNQELMPPCLEEELCTWIF